jgi:hypothetical protein
MPILPGWNYKMRRHSCNAKVPPSLVSARNHPIFAPPDNNLAAARRSAGEGALRLQWTATVYSVATALRLHRAARNLVSKSRS